ncbi:SpoIIE family protein phosphatase [Streptomyces sp. HUCO-GS316]|nr:SpoIIE family protein phosphatase [Streptomyces sp. HUCO-GS316]
MGCPHAEGAVGSTRLYAVYDPVSRRCTFSNAGHIPPIVLPPSGTAELPELPVGPPPGLGGRPSSPHAVDAALLLARTRALSPDAYATWDISDDPRQVARLRTVVAEQLQR